MQVGSTLPMMLQTKFGAKDTLVSIDDVPVLRAVRAEYKLGTKYPAQELLEYAKNYLKRSREVIEDNGKQARGSDEYKNTEDKNAFEEGIAYAMKISKERVESFVKTIETLQGIVNS